MCFFCYSITCEYISSNVTRSAFKFVAVELKVLVYSKVYRLCVVCQKNHWSIAATLNFFPKFFLNFLTHIQKKMFETAEFWIHLHLRMCSAARRQTGKLKEKKTQGMFCFSSTKKRSQTNEMLVWVISPLFIQREQWLMSTGHSCGNCTWQEVKTL